MSSQLSDFWTPQEWSSELLTQQPFSPPTSHSQRGEAVQSHCDSRRRTVSSADSESSVSSSSLGQVSTTRRSSERSGSAGSTMIESSIQTDADGTPVVVHKRIFQCWDHGCGGRVFSTLSNYRRHCREKKLLAKGEIACPYCGKRFTRSSARDAHVEKEISNRSNGTRTSPRQIMPAWSQQPVHHDTTSNSQICYEVFHLESTTRLPPVSQQHQASMTWLS